MAQKAQTEYGGICGRDAFMARVDAFLHTNERGGIPRGVGAPQDGQRERKRRHALDFSAASVDESRA